MLAPVMPDYQFTDGPAFVVGNYPIVVEEDPVKVYIPSLMSEIDFNDKEVKQVLTGLDNSVFLNANHPNLKGTVTSVNCVTANISADLVIRKSNSTLYEENDEPIENVPLFIELKPGEEVEAQSNTASFKDAYLY